MRLLFPSPNKMRFGPRPTSHSNSTGELTDLFPRQKPFELQNGVLLDCGLVNGLIQASTQS